LVLTLIARFAATSPSALFGGETPTIYIMASPIMNS
jgi:hypothetical protein